jgi:UDP-glucose 4-epimerase
MAAVVGVFRVLAEPVNVIETNIRGCERLLSAIAQTSSKARVIIASSSSVYGDSKKPELNENNDLLIKPFGHSLSMYAVSKIAQEAVALSYYKEHKIPVTIIRLFNIIGPRQTGRYGMVVPRFIQQACNNKPITIFGDGTQTRSFCDVRDAIQAINLLADKTNTIGETINVGNNYEISINELAKLVQMETRSASSFQYIPYEIAYKERFSDTTQRRPDINKLISLTGFHHQWNLQRTIADLVHLYE